MKKLLIKIYCDSFWLISEGTLYKYNPPIGLVREKIKYILDNLDIVKEYRRVNGTDTM